MGYHTFASYSGRINGIFGFREHLIVHAGTSLYIHGEEPQEIYNGLNDDRSSALILAEKLWFVDGSILLGIGEWEEGVISAKPAADEAYVPTVYISVHPEGGGEPFEKVNMLTDMRSDSFLGTADAKVYQLSYMELTDAEVTVKVMNSKGELVEKTSGFTVDRTTGRVTFDTAPGVSPVTGEDNVVITYGVDNSEYRKRLYGCRFGICYGVAGATDRIFLSGNPEYPNYDWWCNINDPTYWGDQWYGTIGKEESPIMGYSIINQYLATHKASDDNERNIYTRYGTLDEKGNAEFNVQDIIQGAGAVSRWSFAYIKEPMYLTDIGIVATTPYEFNSERYVQGRSFYLNGRLLEEEDLSEAVAVAYKDFYALAIGGRVYLLDTLQKTGQNSAKSEYQYEGYLWDNIPARVLFFDGDALMFGDADGNIMRFNTDTESLLSYNDNGEAIKCRWDFDFSGEDFYRKKRIKHFAIRLNSYAITSVEVWKRVKGIWQRQFAEPAAARYLSFSQLSFRNFTFTSDSNPRSIERKINIRRVDAVRFSLRNEEVNQPFGIFEYALEFSESGYYKG